MEPFLIGLQRFGIGRLAAIVGVSAGVALALAALVLHAGGVLPFAVIWINHIGVDRLMGHGLKYSDGFGFTHLGRMGRARA